MQAGRAVRIGPGLDPPATRPPIGGMKTLPIVLAVAAALAAPAGLAAQSPTATPASYTTEQAERGREAYRASCLVCHAEDLGGSDQAPPLAGDYFTSSWGGHSVGELLAFVKENMPLTRPSSLDDATYAAIVAYLLSMNGAEPGRAQLAMDSPGVVPAGN